MRTARQGPASHPTKMHQTAGANQQRNQAKEEEAAMRLCSGEAMHAVGVLAGVVSAVVIGMTDLISFSALHLQ